ncbi:MMPL family transporter [Baekduia soli]|uniref:MMPL family transporter n=1 Tax=Baekduia soli TaxID=496014 RepID=A0A5B8U2W3_9ACTN|nr:MMPL family transporter [Baekduia soli]QEC47366.1 MMPL family transporter [Baekduia soli]
MRSLARWCYTHRRIVLLGWIGAVVALSAVHGAAGSDYRDTFKLPGTDSADALNLLKSSAPKASGDTERIVVAVRSGSVTDAAVRAKVEAMLARVAKLPHVATVTSPYGAGAGAQISRSGRIAYATVTMDGDPVSVPVSAGKRLITTAQDAAGGGLQVELGGQVIQQARQQGVGGTFIGFVAALVVLLLVFGSLLAAILPLLATGLSLAAGIAVIGLLSHILQMASFSSELSLLIGLGVGVDYALFIVTRFRQALMRGKTPEEAVVQAIDTSGRAVLFAGITVCIALLGMFALGVSFLYGVAVAASIVVACTVIAALTLLPALLGFFGPKVLTRRQRRSLAAGSYTTTDESPAWARWAGRLQRRPLPAAIVAAVAMLVLAAPFLSLRTGSSDQGSDPAGSTTRKAYDLLAEGFGPGFNGPLQLVARVNTAADKARFDKVLAAVGRTDGVVATGRSAVVGGTGDRGVALAQVFPKGSPQDKSTSDLVRRLRRDVVPAAAGTGGVHVLVGGQTAIFIDFSKVLTGKLPLFIGIVVLLSFLLLMVVFRSLVIPAMAAVMNLLSIGASFGIVVAIFQWGWGAELIGISREGPIEAFLPVMVFAILFGLSMDYEVFLVSRIYEEWHRRGDNREAVKHGLAATGRTITAAAAIMVLVFAAFVLGGERVIKLFGIGLASAVLFDALVVRSVLVPGMMLAIGEANWWLPSWLERILPRLNVEGAVDDDAPPPPVPAPLRPEAPVP